MLGTRLISVEAFLPWLLQFFGSELDVQAAARIASEDVEPHHLELQSTDFKSPNLCYSMHLIHYWTPLVELLHTGEVELRPYLHYEHYRLRSSDQIPSQTNWILHSLLPLWFVVRPLPTTWQLLSQLIAISSFPDCSPSFANSSPPSAHTSLSSAKSLPHGQYSTISTLNSDFAVAAFDSTRC